MNPQFAIRSPKNGSRAAANAPRSFGAAPAPAAALSHAGTGILQGVIQRYQPTTKDLENEREFKISIDRGKTWFVATIIAIDEERGWTFEDEDGEHFIANHRYIKEIKDEPEDSPQNPKKRSLFDAETTYTECQFPGCKAKLKNKDELYEHVKFNHPFPEATSYPYLLFGGQNALSHTLSKHPKEGEKEPKFKAVSRPTGSGYHSEWNATRELPKKRIKDSKQPEFSATTSVPSFMDKKEDAPQSLFLTGEPHCGLCSNTLPKVGLPVAYPTNARPSQSPGYAIPKTTPKMEGVFKDFVGKPDFDTPEYKSFKREHFPEKLVTAPEHNKQVAAEHKKEGGEQYTRFMAQSMALNKDKFDTLFENFGKGEMDRDGLKKALGKHPIPETPHTFMPYCPSPIWKPNESEDDETGMVLDDEHEENRRKILLQRAILSISKAFDKIKQSGKVTVEKEDEESINPVGINNCLITAMNSGVPAEINNVTIIRTLIKDQVGTEFGEYLQAEPEVIFTIAKTLGLTGKQVRIYQGDEEEASQIFIIQDDGTVIETEGDEVEDYPAPANGYIHIEHQGGNHFEFLE